MERLEKKSGTGSPEETRDLEAVRRAMTKRRMEVLQKLGEEGELSQGELAQRIHAKPTALSNLLLKFDAFSPRLIEKRSDGKFCYYSLTKWGRQIVEGLPEDRTIRIREDGAAQEKEDEFLFQMAKASLEELKQEYGEKWCVIFEDVLVYYLKTVKDVPDKKQRALVNRYLQSLELLRIHQNDRQGNQTLGLLTERLHRYRVTEFMDDLFHPFIIVLKSLRDKDLIYPVTTVLQHYFTGSPVQPEDIRSLGWDRESLEELARLVKRIAARLEVCGEREIYEYCTALFPDQEMLSRLISQWLGNRAV